MPLIHHTLLGLVLVGAVACTSSTESRAPLGAMMVTVATTGQAPDPDGYQLSVAARAFALRPQDSLILTDLQAGSTPLRLSGLAANCVADPANPSTVLVRGADTTTVRFHLYCPASTGTIHVTVTTTGLEPDEDGYHVGIAGYPSVTIDANGSASLAGVDSGFHAIQLSNVAGNCALVGTNLPVHVAADGTASAALQVHCGWLLIYADGVLRRVTPDGVDEVRLPSQLPIPDYAQFSRDGQLVTFSSFSTGNNEVYLMTRDGGGLTQVTRDPAVDWTPAFTPDGTGLVFVTNRGGYEWPRLHRMALDGTGLQPLVQDSVRNSHPRFSPDGAVLAYTGNASTGYDAIWTMGANGASPTQLTPGTCHSAEPSWSPDGQHITFTSDCSGAYEIHVMDATGANSHQLTHLGGNPNLTPLWSPGGQYIAFTRQLNDQGAVRQTYLMRADGTELHQILTQYQYVWPYDWQPR